MNKNKKLKIININLLSELTQKVYKYNTKQQKKKKDMKLSFNFQPSAFKYNDENNKQQS